MFLLMIKLLIRFRLIFRRGFSELIFIPLYRLFGIPHYENRFFDIDPIYCHACGACGEELCCPPLICAYKNMVEYGVGLYCDKYYLDIEFSYRLAEELFDKYTDDEIYDRLYKKVYYDRRKKIIKE